MRVSKPTKAITYTLNGTTGDDTISLLGGHLALNGTP